MSKDVQDLHLRNITVQYETDCSLVVGGPIEPQVVISSDIDQSRLPLPEADKLHVWLGRALGKDWHPIETVPKDGTEVLLAWEVTTGIWGMALASWGTLPGVGIGWLTGSEEEGFNINVDTPSHWQPRPAPPSKP